MSMQQGFLVFSKSMRASRRAEPTARLVEAPENRRNHPASTRIGGSYGKSGLDGYYPPRQTAGFSMPGKGPAD